MVKKSRSISFEDEEWDALKILAEQEELTINLLIQKVMKDYANSPTTTQNSDESIEQKIKKQTYLKLCLQNWEGLKRNGTIFEEAKAIIIGQKELAEPSMEFREKNRDCGFCHHTHSENYPHSCPNCNCGIRG